MDSLLVVASKFDELAASLNAMPELLLGNTAAGARYELARGRANHAAELTPSRSDGGGYFDAMPQ